MNMLDTVKYIVSEEGVKSYIVKQILDLLNDRISYYLDKLKANCICTFNEYFEEQILNENRKICSYFNYSASERKTIDLSILFAFQDIKRIQGDTVYNVSVLDEIIDSAFDHKGTEMILNVVKERVKKNNECVLIISHRPELLKMEIDDVIFLEKKDGVTRRIDKVDF